MHGSQGSNGAQGHHGGQGAGGGNPHLQRLRLLRPFAGRLAAGMLFMVVTVLIQLAYPKALSYFIDHIRDHPGTQLQDRWYGTLALGMLCALCAQAAAATLRYYLFESAGYLVVTRIRRLLFAALMRQPVGFYDKHHVGELTNRLSADVEILHETMTMGAAVSLRCLLMFIGGTAMLLTISPLLSLMLLFFVPASLALSKWAGQSYRARAQEIQAGLAECGKVAHEHFSHVRLVHAFGQQRTARARYAQATGRALAIALASCRQFALFRGASSLLVYLALLGTLWFGARLIGQGALTVGALTAFVIYANMVTEAAGAISDFWNTWMRTLGATDRIFAIIGDNGDSGDGGDERAAATPAAPPLRLGGALSFDRVEFAYPERPEIRALQGVSLTIAAGEQIALVGASGAGKSTIASLILGFYQPDRGAICFDGVPAAALDIGALRRNLAIVEQEPALFSGSIYDNIAFAVPEREAGLDEVMRAAALADAHDFIAAFPRGYQTVVGERGVQLSGGQKQRIAIARALLRDPRILILDEATSALDSATELQVQRALERLMAGRTTIIIAHRYSTIVQSDRILVMAGGRVVQQGSHDALIAERDGLYFDLMRHQLAPYRAMAGQSALLAG